MDIIRQSCRYQEALFVSANTSNGKIINRLKFLIFFSSIRQSAYHTLSLWCKIAKSGCSAESIADELVKYILQDITPYQSEVTLKVLYSTLPNHRKLCRN